MLFETAAFVKVKLIEQVADYSLFCRNLPVAKVKAGTDVRFSLSNVVISSLGIRQGMQLGQSIGPTVVKLPSDNVFRLLLQLCTPVYPCCTVWNSCREKVNPRDVVRVSGCHS